MAEKSKAVRKTSLEPVIWSSLLLIAGLAILFYYLYPRVTAYIDNNQITVPQTPPSGRF